MFGVRCTPFNCSECDKLFGVCYCQLEHNRRLFQLQLLIEPTHTQALWYTLCVCARGCTCVCFLLLLRPRGTTAPVRMRNNYSKHSHLHTHTHQPFAFHTGGAPCIPNGISRVRALSGRNTHTNIGAVGNARKAHRANTLCVFWVRMLVGCRARKILPRSERWQQRPPHQRVCVKSITQLWGKW